MSWSLGHSSSDFLALSNRCGCFLNKVGPLRKSCGPLSTQVCVTQGLQSRFHWRYQCPGFNLVQIHSSFVGNLFHNLRSVTCVPGICIWIKVEKRKRTGFSRQAGGDTLLLTKRRPFLEVTNKVRKPLPRSPRPWDWRYHGEHPEDSQHILPKVQEAYGPQGPLLCNLLSTFLPAWYRCHSTRLAKHPWAHKGRDDTTRSRLLLILLDRFSRSC